MVTYPVQLWKLQHNLLPPGTDYSSLPRFVQDNMDELKETNDLLFVGKMLKVGYYIMASNIGPVLWSENRLYMIPDQKGVSVVSVSYSNIINKEAEALNKKAQLEAAKMSVMQLEFKAKKAIELAKLMYAGSPSYVIEQETGNIMHWPQSKLFDTLKLYKEAKKAELEPISKKELDAQVSVVQGVTGTGAPTGGIGYGDKSDAFIDLLKKGTYNPSTKKSDPPKTPSPPEPSQEGSKGEEGLRPILPKRRINWD